VCVKFIFKTLIICNLQAVVQTGADTAEGAIAWVFENDMGGAADEGESSEMYQDYKMVFVVNTSLPMTPGKIAAQVRINAFT
jgi:hypothetical protein